MNRYLYTIPEPEPRPKTQAPLTPKGKGLREAGEPIHPARHATQAESAASALQARQDAGRVSTAWKTRERLSGRVGPGSRVADVAEAFYRGLADESPTLTPCAPTRAQKRAMRRMRRAAR